MADYMETTVSGKKWRRCGAVVINNPYKSAPTIIFQEQDVIELPEGYTAASAVGDLLDGFDPARPIELLDPSTGEPVGTSVPEGLVYQALFSKYMALAKARDSATRLEPTEDTSDEGEANATP